MVLVRNLPLVYYEVIDGSSDQLIDWLESEPDPYEHYTMHCFLSIAVVLMNVAWSLARATISPDHISVHGKENFSPDSSSSSSGPNTDPRYGSALVSHTGSNVEVLAKINNLRRKGRTSVRNKQYQSAIQCYSAILQIVEGVSDEEYSCIRRRSALTLAECEVKVGNLRKAIARFSEVINEAPLSVDRWSASYSPNSTGSIDHTDSEISRAIGKALFKRGLSMKQLNYHYYALLDLQESLKYNPDSVQAYEEIAALEASDEVIALSRSNESEASLIDKHIDIIEEYQLSYPRTTLSDHQLNLLVNRVSSNDRRGYATANYGPSATVTSSRASLSSPFPTNPFSSLMGFDTPGTPSPGGADSGSLASSSGSGLSMNSLIKLVPLIGSMLGVEATTIGTISEVLQAMAVTYRRFNTLVKYINDNRQAVLLIFTLVWVCISVILPSVGNYKWIDVKLLLLSKLHL